MEKKTQLERVKDKLRKDGVVTNVWAFRETFPAILRLGSIINVLRDEIKDTNWWIETEINTDRTGKNCHYWLRKK